MISPTLMCDFYKISHREQYPPQTEIVYSTWTPRESKIEGVDKVVVFGVQGFVKKYLIDYFDEYFFREDINQVCDEYTRVISYCLGIQEPDVKHLRALHKLGHLPLEIRSLPEGSLCPIRVPMMTIRNTHAEFAWLTNYVETLMSCCLWQPMTSATLAHEYRKIMEKWSDITGCNNDDIDFQGHDFSMRGMSSLESAETSGAGHLLSFTGTDTIPAIRYLEDYYGANIEDDLIGTSVPATEHSVMCAYGEDELTSYKRLINEVYPSGIVSIVSDTWDLWGALEIVIRPLKDDIMKRDGKVVIRPDSGDPVEIICGNPILSNPSPCKGVIEILWDIFGGTINEKGYKVLDSHIGAIYGDAITRERCEEILLRLEDKGFASSNIIFGIGSYTFQYNTRDTFGFAMKSTLCIINGKEKQIFKKPKTDSGMKNSLKGGVRVDIEDGELFVVDGLSLNETYKDTQLQTVFWNGEAQNTTNLNCIKRRMKNERDFGN